MSHVSWLLFLCSFSVHFYGLTSRSAIHKCKDNLIIPKLSCVLCRGSAAKIMQTECRIPSFLVCYAEVPLNFCKVNIYFLQIGCKCHSLPSPSLFHGFFIRRLDSVSSLSSHPVPMSVPFSANDRLIQYQWGHHSLLLADCPPISLGLTPPWHLPDTFLTPLYDINDTYTVCYLMAWHLDT